MMDASALQAWLPPHAAAMFMATDHLAGCSHIISCHQLPAGLFHHACASARCQHHHASIMLHVPPCNACLRLAFLCHVTQPLPASAALHGPPCCVILLASQALPHASCCAIWAYGLMHFSACGIPMTSCGAGSHSRCRSGTLAPSSRCSSSTDEGAGHSGSVGTPPGWSQGT